MAQHACFGLSLQQSACQHARLKSPVWSRPSGATHSSLQIMVGAVSRVLKVERCERVQLVAAAVRLYIASCHDCVFYLGVNRAPLLLGDNRFLQVHSIRDTAF